jgi:hypothetical protein
MRLPSRLGASTVRGWGVYPLQGPFDVTRVLKSPGGYWRCRTDLGGLPRTKHLCDANIAPTIYLILGFPLNFTPSQISIFSTWSPLAGV